MSHKNKRKIVRINFFLVIGPIFIIEILARTAGFIYNDFSVYYLLYGFNNSDMRLTTNAVVFDGYFKFSPDSKVTQGPLADLRIPSQINNIGLRGTSEISLAKPERTIRIISLGGSSTFGYHARDDHTYPFLLERTLRSRILGWQVEVINAGIPNFDSVNILTMFRKELVYYQPDAITLYTAYNDASAILDETWWQGAARWLHDHVAVYVALGRVLKWATSIELYSKWSDYVAAPSADYVDKQIALHVDRYRRNVQETLDLARETGSLVVLIRQPMGLSYRANADRPDYAQTVQMAQSRLSRGEAISGSEVTLLVHAALLDVLEEIALEKDVQLVDNVRLVDTHKDRLLTYVHLSEDGNDALASALAGTLMPMLAKRYLLSGGE